MTLNEPVDLFQNVYVEVIGSTTDSTNQIAWGDHIVESLVNRVQDLRNAIGDAARIVMGSLDSFPRNDQWETSEVSGRFGLTLAAEGGVILSKAGIETTFEVEIKFTRTNV